MVLGWAMQGMGWDQDGWLFSLDGAFLSEKKNSIRVGQARDGMRSGQMTLFVRLVLFERKEKSYRGGPCKGWYEIMTDDYFRETGPFWAKWKIVLGWAMQGMGWDQDGWLFSLDGAFLSEKKNSTRVAHARDGMRSGRITLFVRPVLFERKEKSFRGGPCKGWDETRTDDSFR